MANQNDDIRVQLATMFTEHDYNKRYERLSVVYYMIDGKIEFYQAIKDVPRFTPISDTRVWNKSTYDIITSSEEPTFDNDFIPIYFPPEVGEQVPIYLVESYDDDLFIIQIMTYYVVPNQTTQPEITGVKINNVSYTLVSSEDAEPAPGLAVIEVDTMFIDEEMYEEIQYMKQIGVDIDANIGGGLFLVMLNAFSDTAPSGPITFELNTDVGNCTVIVPQYVEPKQSYIYVVRDDTYSIEFSNYYSYDHNDTPAWASYLESDFGNETTITVFGTYVACTGWQESSDGETWTDIPNSASNELEVTIPEESHYYKPIVVSTEPNWVEISSGYPSQDTSNNTCLTEDGINTGMQRVLYDAVEEDQNPYSETYMQTRTNQTYIIEQNLTACPIPNITYLPVHIEAFVEYDDGNSAVLDSSKASLSFKASRDLYSLYENHPQISNPFNGNIKLLDNDTTWHIIGNITCNDGYELYSWYYKRDSDDDWIQLNGDHSFYKRMFVEETSIEIKAVIKQAITKQVSANVFVEFTDNNEFDQPITRISVLKSFTESSVYAFDNIADIYDNPTTISYTNGHYILIKPNLNSSITEYEIVEEYFRYSENDSWTQIPLSPAVTLDPLQSHIDIKWVLQPAKLHVNITFFKEEVINNETVLTVDNSSGSVRCFLFDKQTLLNPSPTVGSTTYDISSRPLELNFVAVGVFNNATASNKYEARVEYYDNYGKLNIAAQDSGYVHHNQQYQCYESQQFNTTIYFNEHYGYPQPAIVNFIYILKANQ